MRLRILFSAAGLVALCGCDSTDRVLFLTSTNMGINADVTSRTANIGYDRTEGVVGPAFVDTGDVPQVVAFIQSDLAVFNPKVKQLYATGAAAALATDSTLTKPNPLPPATGPRRVMFFGTTSNIGLKIGFAGDMPESINFGYKRKEMSLIPLHVANPDGSKPDIYPSVLASIDMAGTTGTLAQTGLSMTQFFATGVAATNLAVTPGVRKTFTRATNDAVERGVAVGQAII